MKTILITGGAGFIGSNFARYLYEKYPSYKIIILDALTYAGSVVNTPNRGFNNDRYEFWYGNVVNAELVNKLVSQSEYVFHFAAESHVTRSIYDNKTFFETDVMGTQVVANAVLHHLSKVKLFVHISTSEVYGTAETDLMNEGHPLNPMSPYAAAKAGADRLVYSYNKTYGIPSVIIRPFNNYGPYQHLEKVIPRFITSAILGEPLTMHGDGSACRDFIHVLDHCRALEMLLHIDSSLVIGQEINIASGMDISVLDIAHSVLSLLKTKSEIQVIGNRPGQVFRHTGDSTKAKNLLNWKASISFDEGLKSTIDWYKNNEHLWNNQKWMRSIPIKTIDGKEERH